MKTQKNKLINLGTRNKGTFWEYLAAYSFLKAKFPGSRFCFAFYGGIGRGISNKHCHSQEDIDRNIKIFIAEFEKGLYDNAYFKKLIDDYMKGLVDAKMIAAVDDFSKLSNQRLISLFNRAWKDASLPNPAMLQALYNIYLNDFFKGKIWEVLSEKERQDRTVVNGIQTLLLTKKGFSVIDREEQTLYGLKKLFRSKYHSRGIDEFLSDPFIKKRIKKLADDFGWFHMEYSADPFTPQEYERHIRRALADGKKEYSPVAEEKTLRQRKKDFFLNHKDSAYLKKLSGVLEKFAFVLEDTKSTVIKSFFLCLPLYNEIARRLGLGHYKDMLFLVPPEIVSYLENGKPADKKLIAKRKASRFVILKGRKISWGEGQAVSRLEKKYLPKEEEDAGAAEAKGITAYPGKVTGKAVLVKSIADHQRFKRGDIMITHDGSAELTIMLKEAGAIVTNEGGIICHAATVAREFKTPCVVGTKVATKIIRDGDIVEVDADNGIIRRIK